MVPKENWTPKTGQTIVAFDCHTGKKLHLVGVNTILDTILVSPTLSNGAIYLWLYKLLYYTKNKIGRIEGKVTFFSNRSNRFRFLAIRRVETSEQEIFYSAEEIENEKCIGK